MLFFSKTIFILFCEAWVGCVCLYGQASLLTLYLLMTWKTNFKSDTALNKFSFSYISWLQKPVSNLQSDKQGIGCILKKTYSNPIFFSWACKRQLDHYHSMTTHSTMHSLLPCWQSSPDGTIILVMALTLCAGRVDGGGGAAMTGRAGGSLKKWHLLKVPSLMLWLWTDLNIKIT